MKPQFFFLLLIFLKYSCIIGKWKIKDDKNGKKEESLFLTSSYVISSQNISILFSDDSKCNAIIKENIHYYLSNGKFSDLTRRVTLKPNIEDFRNIVVSSNDLTIIDTNIIRGCNKTSLTFYSEICINIVFEMIDVVDSMIDVEIFYQYEAVSILKSEVRTYTNSKYNTFIFTIENENNYHVNNVQIFVTFNLINQPLENLTTITPENYKIIEVNNKISQISFDFFEIRIKEAFELNIKFSEIIHGCSDPKALQYFSEKDSAYLTATWIVLFVFLILIMLILYCGEITNLNKKKK